MDNCLILEYIGGMDLHDYIVSKVNYNGQETYRTYFHQLIRAVEYLHRCGIAHTDIKPENIIVNDELKLLKLIDLGEAKFFGEGQKAKGVCGSIPYIPPEAFGEEEYECDKVDVWSCGIVLYNILFKTMPWMMAVDNKDTNFRAYTRSGRLPNVDIPEVNEILYRMLNTNTMLRTLTETQTAEEVEQDTTPKTI